MGLAYLPDGSLIDYKEYIDKHPHWQKVRTERFKFDGGRCVVCHRDLTGKTYQTHHLHYLRLGNERLRDVITLCPACHQEFHESWTRSNFWKGKESGHWDVYSLEHTARICARYWKQDRLISKDPNGLNLCGKDVCRQLLDEYFRDEGMTRPPRIDPNDISLLSGTSGMRCSSRLKPEDCLSSSSLMNATARRSEGRILSDRKPAGRTARSTTPKSFHQHYLENKNINILMEEVKKYAET